MGFEMGGLTKWFVIGSLLCGAQTAWAAPYVMDFEGFGLTQAEDLEYVEEAYNGGTSYLGVSGPDYGASFSLEARVLCLSRGAIACSNTSHGGLRPETETGGLWFEDAQEGFVDIAAGFVDSFSFLYANPQNQFVRVSVFDDLGGAGTELASGVLGATASFGCTDTQSMLFEYCPFDQGILTFSGIGKSIVFSGVLHNVAFDDLTFTPASGGIAAVPEPSSWMMLIAGFGLVGLAARSRPNPKVKV